MTNLNIYVLNTTPNPEGLDDFCRIVTGAENFTYEVTEELPANLDTHVSRKLIGQKQSNKGSKYLVIRY